MRSLLTILFLLCLIVTFSCANSTSADGSPPIFDILPKATYISPGMIDEASGIANSKSDTGLFWVEQDSGNPPEIFRMRKNGSLTGKVTLKGVTNRDWEDIVLSKGPIPGVDYLYIAETGDNFSKHDIHKIYRFREPAPNEDTVFSVDNIAFKYPDEPHDAEAILVDHNTHDIFVITKRDSKSLIFKLPYPQSTDSVNLAVASGELPFNGVVSAAISADSREMLVKTYMKVYYWTKDAGEPIEKALQRQSKSLPYKIEPQGEAICFASDNTGFFTLSEKPFSSSSVDLNFYKRR